MEKIPDRFYRVSVKALVLNETKDKFLICKKTSGLWEFPGGGLEWGEVPQNGLEREIKEEMGVGVKRIADTPAYFVTGRSEPNKGIWLANVLYETELESLDFTPTDECVEIQFVDHNDTVKLNVFTTVTQVAKLYFG